MKAPKPQCAIVWKAIVIYLHLAYGTTIPTAVRGRLQTLRLTSDEEFYASQVFERDTTSDKMSLRLGNHLYPHMKLIIERSADGSAFLFRADTHDGHCCPAVTSREYQAFRQLMADNQQIAADIETAWTAAGIPTFKEYLREDLRRRLGA